MHPSLPFKRQFNLQGPRAKQNITNNNETQTGTQAPGKKKRRGEEEVHGGKICAVPVRRSPVPGPLPALLWPSRVQCQPATSKALNTKTKPHDFPLHGNNKSNEAPV